jgi:DNA-binding beta-propeller fold protein YncE
VRFFLKGTQMLRHKLAFLAVAAMAALGSGAMAADPQFKMIKTLPLGGAGRWDYLCPDAAARRLYVPRSSHVQIVDLDKGEVLGDVPNTRGVHGVALASEQGLGFATDGQDNAVTVFDLKTFAVSKTIKTGANPDPILFEPFSKKIWSINHSGGSITVIDPAALDKEPVTIQVGGTLEAGVTDGKGHVFVNVENKSEVVQIDAKENRVLAHWSVAPGDGPTGLAIDVEHHRLFAGCGNSKCVVLDSESGKQLAAVTVGRGIDGVGFEPTLGVAFTANGQDGTVSVVKETAEGKFEAIQTVKTINGARTINVDTKMHQALLPCNVPDGKGGTTFGIAVVGVEGEAAK